MYLSNNYQFIDMLTIDLYGGLSVVWWSEGGFVIWVVQVRVPPNSIALLLFIRLRAHSITSSYMFESAWYKDR